MATNSQIAAAQVLRTAATEFAYALRLVESEGLEATVTLSLDQTTPFPFHKIAAQAYVATTKVRVVASEDI